MFSESEMESAPQRQALASSPDTPPDVLAILAADGNLHVRRAAAKNPSTPSATLQLLGRAGATPDLMGFGGSVDALSIQEIGELVGLGEWGRLLAAQHADADPDMLRNLAESGGTALRHTVATHPACPAEVLGALCGDVDPAVRQAAAAHPNVPSETVAMLGAAGSRTDLSGWLDEVPAGEIDTAGLIAAGSYGKQLAARHPRVDPDTLAELAQDTDWRVRAAVAENPAAAGGLLEALAGLDVFETRQRVAGHPQTPAATLEQLAQEPDIRIRVEVARNTGTPSPLLRKLALDGSSAVREFVSAHPALTQADRDWLTAAGTTPDLQQFIEPDSTLDESSLEELAAAGGWGQRLAARHPATPTRILAVLITSGDPMLRDVALRHPACPLGLIDLLVAAGSSDDLQGFERGARSLPVESIDQLIKLGPWARRLAARQRSASDNQLEALSQDEDMAVRVAVAKNPATPVGVADAMVHDVAHDVRWALVNRADVSAEALGELLHDAIPAIRLAAVANPTLPPSSLELLKFDLDEDVRAAVRKRLAQEA
ncbi:MAG: hypothetical protein AAGA25_13400 [Planctomycetota bacterium]